jgi:hypothetical protein
VVLELMVVATVEQILLLVVLEPQPRAAVAVAAELTPVVLLEQTVATVEPESSLSDTQSNA